MNGTIHVKAGSPEQRGAWMLLWCALITPVVAVDGIRLGATVPDLSVPVSVHLAGSAPGGVYAPAGGEGPN